MIMLQRPSLWILLLFIVSVIWVHDMYLRLYNVFSY